MTAKGRLIIPLIIGGKVLPARIILSFCVQFHVLPALRRRQSVQKKYRPPNDYYKFLRELPYATDPQYINKLKRIVNDQRNSK